MTVQDKAFVEIEYTLTLDSGEVVDRSAPEKPLGFIFGVNAIIPAFQHIGTPHTQAFEALHIFAEEVMPKVQEAT